MTQLTQLTQLMQAMQIPAQFDQLCLQEDEDSKIVGGVRIVKDGKGE